MRLLERGLRRVESGQSDPCVWWQPSSKGIFTTRSAYTLLTQDENAQDSFNWNSIWNFKGPLRGSLLLWQAAHKLLKSNSLLWEKKIMDDPGYEICTEGMETPLHTLRDCKLSTAIWQRLLSGEVSNHFWLELDIKEWIKQNIRKGGNIGKYSNKWSYIFPQGILEL